MMMTVAEDPLTELLRRSSFLITAFTSNNSPLITAWRGRTPRIDSSGINDWTSEWGRKKWGKVSFLQGDLKQRRLLAFFVLLTSLYFCCAKNIRGLFLTFEEASFHFCFSEDERSQLFQLLLHTWKKLYREKISKVFEIWHLGLEVIRFSLKYRLLYGLYNEFSYDIFEYIILSWKFMSMSLISRGTSSFDIFF